MENYITICGKNVQINSHWSQADRVSNDIIYDIRFADAEHTKYIVTYEYNDAEFGHGKGGVLYLGINKIEAWQKFLTDM